MTLQGQLLSLVQTPRVVGTIITEDFLHDWSERPKKLPCDLVELRVDGFPQAENWVQVGEEIEGFEIPVFATIRLAKEGGKWTGGDADRWGLLEPALRRLSGADVEIQSELADIVARMARDLKKICILSYHNFRETPPVPVMRRLIEQAHERGAIGKLAVTLNTPEDLTNLRSLLAEKWPLPVCLIGMGPLGRETRLDFPRQGSCFTYGYLDAPGAPGQYSAAELVAHFSAHPVV